MEAQTPDDELRKQAKERLESKRGFRNFAVVAVLVNAMLVVVWAVTGAGFFWPIFPIAGMGIALALQAWGLYGEKPVTEADIQREIDRQRGA